MSKAVEVIRKYNVSDAEMLQVSRVIYGLYLEDQESFTTLDPAFNAAYAEGWLSAIEEGETAARDLTVKDELVLLTAAVHEKLEACRSHFQKMKYYIEKAFPGNTAVWNAFGFNDYEKARKGEKDMMPFMRTLHTQAVKYVAELTAVNFPQAEIDKIAALAAELQTADHEQEMYKKNRLVITQERVESLNKAWGYLVDVNKASKVIFAGNYAKLKQYFLPGEASTKQDEEPVTPVES